MKERELREHADCSLCHQKIGHTGVPLFWVVTIERHGVDLRAVKRQDGLAAFMGSPMIAQVMGPDEEMTMPLMEPLTLTLCESCANHNDLPISAMAEARADGHPA